MMMSCLKLVTVVVLYLQLKSVTGFKPVVLIHGIFDHKHTLDSMADQIREQHPGTIVYKIDKLHGWKSITPMWFQVRHFRKALDPIMQKHPEGVNLIGFSQGGLVARGLIQSSSYHNINTFISLSSPQAGQYGDQFIHILFPNEVRGTIYKIFYSRVGQEISVGNYWRDPKHIPKFLNYSNFLARLDNCVNTSDSSDFKNNFTKLKRLILIGGPDDGVISPWQSSQFGFYNKNLTVLEMRDRLEYHRDLFGLKTLDKEKKVVRITVPGVKHREWHRNVTVINNHILPYLD